METDTTQLNSLRAICTIYCESANSVLMVLSKDPIKAGDLGVNLGAFNDLFHYEGLAARREANTEITMYNIVSFGSELRGNLLKMNDSDRIIYKKIIDSEIGVYLERIPAYHNWINHPPLFNEGPYINGMKINIWLGTGLLNFASDLRTVLNLLKEVDHTIDKYYSLFNLKKLDIEQTQLIEPDEQDQSTESDKGLSAPQKLLFIRLLQQTRLFPQKQANTDDAPELRAVALLTGLDFKNDIKGGKGADFKVNQLLNNRKSLSRQQIPHKIADLEAVEVVARLLNLDPVIEQIRIIRADLEKIRPF